MPNSFKDLNINLETYDKLIKDHESFSLDSPIKIQKKGTGHHHTIIKNGKSVRFIAYFKTKGTTTFQIIDPADGIVKDFLDEICKKCIVNKTNNGYISCPDFHQDSFELLIEFLQEENDLEEIKNNDTEIRYKVVSKYKDSITVVMYPTTNNLLIQGRPLYLYTETKSLLSGLIDFDKVIEIESNQYEIDIKPDDIQIEIRERLAPVIDFLDEKIIKIIAPSFVLMKIEIQLDDYSTLVFPALKGIEGYIRKLLSEYSKNHGNTKHIGSLFKNKSFEPSNFLKEDIANDNVCLALEDAYSIYYKQRHSLFHTNPVAETTRIIETKQQAEALINEIFDVICSSFLRI